MVGGSFCESCTGRFPKTEITQILFSMSRVISTRDEVSKESKPKSPCLEAVLLGRSSSEGSNGDKMYLK